MPGGTALFDVVEFSHDVVGALDKVPDVEEVAGWRRRCAPGGVSLESFDQVLETGGDFVSDVQWRDGGRALGRVEH